MMTKTYSAKTCSAKTASAASLITTPALPGVTELFAGFSDRSLSARRDLAKCFAAAAACVYEDRTTAAGEVSLLLAGAKPAKSSLDRRQWTLELGADTDAANPDREAYRSRVRLICEGELPASLVAELDELVVACERERHSRRLGKFAAGADAAEPEHFTKHGIFACGAATRETIRLIDLFGAERLPVLITGENGTGKERVAQGLHAVSKRRGAMVTLNCGAIPRDLIASELFGNEKGAFSGAHLSKPGAFEAANGGTLFLDEIGDMPAEQQVALLRVLQEGTVKRIGSHTEKRVDVRIIAATNKDLEALVRSGEFREDLYFRLNVLTVHIAPLRERAEEIAGLARHYIAKLSQERNRNLRLTECAGRVLTTHAWRGNVRELVHALERAAVYAGSDGVIDAARLGLSAVETLAETIAETVTETTVEIDGAVTTTTTTTTTASAFGDREANHSEAMPDEHFDDTLRGETFDEQASVHEITDTADLYPADFATPSSKSYDEQMREFERGVLERALRACRWNAEAAAAHLGMPGSTCRRRLHELGITRPAGFSAARVRRTHINRSATTMTGAATTTTAVSSPDAIISYHHVQ